MENEKYILDTNFVFSYLTSFDSNNPKAIKIMSNLLSNNKYITDYIYLELATIISQKLGKDYWKIINKMIIDPVSGLKEIKVSNSIYETTKTKYLKIIKKDVSFIDLSIILCAKEFGLSIVTFDREILNLANKYKITTISK
jgi:predicted nucleic acid-binding protein